MDYPSDVGVVMLMKRVLFVAPGLDVSYGSGPLGLNDVSFIVCGDEDLGKPTELRRRDVYGPFANLYPGVAISIEFAGDKNAFMASISEDTIQDV